jgi:hypothetical protein
MAKARISWNKSAGGSSLCRISDVGIDLIRKRSIWSWILAESGIAFILRTLCRTAFGELTGILGGRNPIECVHDAYDSRTAFKSRRLRWSWNTKWRCWTWKREQDGGVWSHFNVHCASCDTTDVWHDFVCRDEPLVAAIWT